MNHGLYGLTYEPNPPSATPKSRIAKLAGAKSHFVTVQRQARFRAEGVARAQTNRLDAKRLARFQDRVPEVRGALGVDEQLERHLLACIARARDDQIKIADLRIA